jgi:hypothetical protein
MNRNPVQEPHHEQQQHYAAVYDQASDATLLKTYNEQFKCPSERLH